MRVSHLCIEEVIQHIKDKCILSTRNLLKLEQSIIASHGQQTSNCSMGPTPYESELGCEVTPDTVGSGNSLSTGFVDKGSCGMKTLHSGIADEILENIGKNYKCLEKEASSLGKDTDFSVDSLLSSNCTALDAGRSELFHSRNIANTANECEVARPSTGKREMLKLDSEINQPEMGSQIWAEEEEDVAWFFEADQSQRNGQSDTGFQSTTSSVNGIQPNHQVNGNFETSVERNNFLAPPKCDSSDEEFESCFDDTIFLSSLKEVPVKSHKSMDVTRGVDETLDEISPVYEKSKNVLEDEFDSFLDKEKDTTPLVFRTEERVQQAFPSSIISSRAPVICVDTVGNVSFGVNDQVMNDHLVNDQIVNDQRSGMVGDEVFASVSLRQNGNSTSAKISALKELQPAVNGGRNQGDPSVILKQLLRPILDQKRQEQKLKTMNRTRYYADMESVLKEHQQASASSGVDDVKGDGQHNIPENVLPISMPSVIAPDVTLQVNVNQKDPLLFGRHSSEQYHLRMDCRHLASSSRCSMENLKRLVDGLSRGNSEISKLVLESCLAQQNHLDVRCHLDRDSSQVDMEKYCR